MPKLEASATQPRSSVSPAQRRLRIAVVSHTYLEPENRKNVVALARYASVTGIVPKTGAVLVFPNRRFDSSTFAQELFRPLSTVRVFASEYLFVSASLGMAQSQPDIITIEYAPWSLVFWQVLLAKTFFAPRARLICMVKKNTYRRYPGVLGRLKRVIVRLALERVHGIAAASHAAAAMYQREFGIAAKRIEVMPHLGVDTDLFRPREGAPRAVRVVVGYCGRLEAEKGVFDLIEALDLCRAKLQAQLSARLLGAGRNEQEIREESRTRPWLQILPAVPNDEVARFLADIDIFVLPTRVTPDHEEHDAHALMEAMAVGLPCVGTRSGIIPEMIDETSGLLVEPGSVEGLARAILLLAKDRGFRDRLGRMARARATQHFSLEAVAERKSSFYKRMAAV